ncbi:MAG TPA: hypothetical protein VF401_03380 [Candidatus Saccharimonadales bacterium]
MADKKESDAAQPKGDPSLEKRVDSMMDPRQPAKPAEPAAKPSAAPAIDIFTDPKTAPEVPSEVLKEVGIDPKTESKSPTSPTPAPATEPAQTAPDDITNPDFENPATDKAVDDIMSTESDTVLAAEDAANKQPQFTKSDWKTKLKALFKQKRTWAVIVVLILVVFGVPQVRYKLLGLVIKKQVSVSVLDSKTNTPVSSAVVTLDGKAAKTDANGKATIKAAVGDKKLVVSKQYFTTKTGKVFVGLKAPAPQKVSLVATGRQVPITVVNSISGKPLANAEIKVLDTTAKTNNKGKAIVVLPTKADQDKATVQLSGFNQAQVTVKVTSEVVAANTFKLTPSGHVYFLSNLNGTIDVVKTNLDGTGRQTVVTGTGKESANDTNLLATRDWRYLVLESKRDARTALYLIDTSNDKMTQFDSSNATFTLVGWTGHNFVYDLVSNTVPETQSNHELLKSYDAENAQLNQLDQNQAEGTPDSYAYQSFGNFYILDNTVVYATRWNTYSSTGSGYDLSSKSNTIRGVQPGRQNKKDYQSFAAAGTGYIQSALYEPQAVHFGVYSYKDNSTTYYNFENQSVSTVSLESSDLTKPYPTYLVSPASNQTFWTELRDGKNTLFTGDINAGSRKQVASLSDYSPYGWFTDNYVLVSKDSSELYIMPVGGGQPLKISDYYKPSQDLKGYGYGYGGL